MITLAAVGFVTLLKLGITALTGISSPLLLYYSAVIFCAWYLKPQYGLLAATLVLLAAHTFFFGSGNFFSWPSAEELFRYLLFSADSLVIIAIATALHRNLKLSRHSQQLRESAESLRQSQQFLDSVVENIPNMLFVKDAKHLRFVRFNRAGEELLGYPRENLIGKSDYDFFPKSEADAFTAKDRAVLEDSRVVDIPEEPLSTKTGIRYLHTKKIPILSADGRPLYLLGISEDITERKTVVEERVARAEAEKTAARLQFLEQASRALSQSLHLPDTLNAFTQIVVEHMADWCEIVLVGEDDQTIEVVVQANRDPARGQSRLEFRNDFEPSRNDAYGVGRVIHSGEPQFYADLNADILDQGVLEPVRRASLKALGLHSVIIVPIKAYGGVMGALTLATAAGGRTFGEFDLSLATDLAKRAALAIENSRLFMKAQEASRAKSAFLANMSHEIRTPLGAMLGFAELLADEKLAPQNMKYVQTVLKNGRQLLRIVDEILDLSKVESNHVAIENIEFSLPTLIEEVMSLLEVQAREKSLRFRVQGVADLPERAVSDPTRLRQILFNVIGNAIKFTARGSIDIRIEAKANAEGRSMVKIEVQDSGIGMTEIQREKLFEPFMQADSSMTRRFGGTGLGLFVSRRLARLLGGDVVLSDSDPARGSLFTITVNVEIPRVRMTMTQPARAIMPPAATAAKRGRVLIVDDAPDNRTLIYHYVNRMGFNADLADNGAEAVDKALNQYYDVVLMDVQMPGMDGFEAVKELRAKEYDRPIVALTAHTMKGDRERCLNEGFDEYLGKPIDRESLRQTLDRYADPALRT
ncbi:MAG TPA: response regulator [Bdellovibrionales bacterium]|nr:response regulator [Bdellovibrionales bacterium]